MRDYLTVLGFMVIVIILSFLSVHIIKCIHEDKNWFTTPFLTSSDCRIMQDMTIAESGCYVL